MFKVQGSTLEEKTGECCKRRYDRRLTSNPISPIIRGQRSEVRGQRTEIRGQRSEVRGQRSEVRDQRSEVRDQRSEIGRQKSETIFVFLTALMP